MAAPVTIFQVACGPNMWQTIYTVPANAIYFTETSQGPNVTRKQQGFLRPHGKWPGRGHLEQREYNYSPGAEGI